MVYQKLICAYPRTFDAHAIFLPQPGHAKVNLNQGKTTGLAGPSRSSRPVETGRSRKNFFALRPGAYPCAGLCG